MVNEVAESVPFIQLFFSALGGGVTVKLLDILYREWKESRSGRQTAKAFLDSHLDPLLKALDELSGKLRYLASRDFRALHDFEIEHNEAAKNHDYTGLLYLLARFWAEVEIIRRDGISISMSDDPRGKMLLQFLDCLESQKIRVVERVVQRAVGEALADDGRILPFHEFIEGAFDRHRQNIWQRELMHFLSRMRHTTERQRLLAYSTVLQVMLDQLDPEHTVSRSRPSIPGKLSKKTWRDLNYRVFNVYLKFVTDRQKYIGPPK